MNDPHVKALHYRLVYGEAADYDRAPPICESTPAFTLYVNKKKAVFEMVEHFATIEAARKVVEPYILAWEILIGLQHYPGDLRFIFDHPEIIDRCPPQHTKNIESLSVCSCSQVQLLDHVKVHVSRGAYPDRPSGFVASPDAEMMYQRFKAYREGRESLTSMAYMCLTVLEAAAGNRTKAAHRYKIDKNVLNTLGRLCSNKGAQHEARKFPESGSFDPLTKQEQKWIIEAIKELIKRVGVCYPHSPKNLKPLAMTDLPTLDI